MHKVFFINPNIRNDEEKSADNTKKSSQENKDKESTQRSGLYEVQEWARKDGDLDSIYIRYLRSGDGNVFIWREVTRGHKHLPQSTPSWYCIFLNVSYITIPLGNTKYFFVFSPASPARGWGAQTM